MAPDGVAPPGGVALVTMVKDEDTFLAHWITHYRRLLGQPRFFILDDGSEQVDPTDIVARLGAGDLCDVIRLPPGPFSDLYKSAALSSLAGLLVPRFAVVIASDVDEIVTPVGRARAKDLERLLHAAPAPFAAPIGVLPVHDTDTEAAFDPARPVADQRSWGFLHGGSTKPVIWKGRAAAFTPGLHSLQGHDVPVIAELATLHLRWVDQALTLRRQEARNRVVFSGDQKPAQGAHWKSPPGQVRKNPLMGPVTHKQTAPGLADAIPAFQRKHMHRQAGHYILGERKILAPVILDGSI